MIVNGMPATDLDGVSWRKSARSNSSGNCVQFARLDTRPGGAGLVGVRDSKDPAGPALVFDSGEVAGFIGALKAGTYDHLTND
jgi:Domain of unknown function (DUF397)